MSSPIIVEPLEQRIAPAALSITDVTKAEGNSALTTFTFDVTLSAADPNNTISVHYQTGPGTSNPATNNTDFNGVGGNLDFAPGEISKQINVSVLGDTAVEQNETFFVDLTNPTAGTTLTKARGVGTILNDDAPNISIGDASTAEGNAGTHNMVFTVTLSAPLNQTVSVDFQTATGSATAPSDYTDTHGTLTIPIGSTTGVINVPVIGDTAVELNETFVLNLTNAVRGNLADGQATGTIINDDSADLHILGKKATYLDENGDLVTVTTSKGAFETANFAFDSAGKQLRILDLSANNSVAGADLTFTAVPQSGAGDGKIKVGYIKAQSGSLGIDLGLVKLPGDLGKIDVGDNSSILGIKGLRVGSLGANGTSSGAPDLQSHIRGSAAAINVAGDVAQASIFLSDVSGHPGTAGIGSLKIGGALTGGAANNSGEIFFTGNLAVATIGSIVGGAGKVSGAILGDYNTLAKISSLTILGNVTGAAGDESAEIAASRIGVLTIAGDVTGAAGNGSGLIQSPEVGRVTIRGSLAGGGGANSGEIFGDTVSAVVIGVNLAGGSAGVGSGNGHSGTIESNSDIGSIRIGGSIIGGDFVDSTHTGSFSGAISVAGKIGSVTVGLDVMGGSGNSSGNIGANGVINRIAIGRDFIGHDSSATMLFNSGYIQAERLPSIFIGHNFEAGSKNGAGVIDSCGAIRATADIGTITIRGDLLGTTNNPAIISAVGQSILLTTATTDLVIRAVKVGGNVDRADILAGYGTDTSVLLIGDPTNADASIGSVKVGGTLSATNIVAGVVPGTGGFFGDTNDVRISGLGTTDRFELISKISSVIVLGHTTGSTTPDSFGVVAQQIGMVNVHRVAVSLTPGPSNDLTPKPIDGNADFNVREVV
jgi:hypothetical protein